MSARSTMTQRSKGPNYDLRASQVETPPDVVKFFWEVVHEHRSRLGSVLDMGAGDGKFARYGNYDQYLGIEMDSSRITDRHPRKDATVIQGCVFAKTRKMQFDACIGNPPYLRHQDIESPWKERTISTLSEELGVPLSGHSNLFLYFMALALIRTTDKGMAALVVPFDWVSRPAARHLRSVISEKKWNVSIYRFSFRVFDDVDTTASISIIDKTAGGREWRFFDVDEKFRIVNRRGPTGTGNSLLTYSRRAGLYARRGLSPGNRHVFVLKEGDRIHHGLSKSDVIPCVTTLRGVGELDVLDEKAFRREFVSAGRRCWLINSRAKKISENLQRYLDAIPRSERATATCLTQQPWYNYEEVKVPDLLLHSGFTTGGPRVVVNEVGAIPLGSMYGIYGCQRGGETELRARLQARRIFRRVVPHSRRLRKIEVGQLNSLLKELEGSYRG